MAKNKEYWSWVEAAVNVIGGKWKLLIVLVLRDGKLRYSEILHKLPSISEKMLVKQLRELERDGIITRTVYPVVPPKVEYSLTEAGEKLVVVLKILGFWGIRYLDDEVVGEGLSREKVNDPVKLRLLLEDIQKIRNDIEKQLGEQD
ncbi:winged helix-turn-helix transcriptional regulator [Methanolacinia petrolearia]|uniref:winged helix-turn-helix transcriptional regulator n=1 Tax=Methanolacinia petrolearia TaxID=54120 RepID=UPI003BAADB91